MRGAAKPDPNPDRTPQHVSAEIAERDFRQTLQLDGIAGDWYISAGEVSELVALAATADVVIIGQHQAIRAGGKFLPREIVVACGRPLLVVPYAGNFVSVGKRVLIAWTVHRRQHEPCTMRYHLSLMRRR